MSSDDPELLDQSVLDLLRNEKDAIFAPEDAKARVLARVGTVIPTLGTSGGGSGGSDPRSGGNDGGGRGVGSPTRSMARGTSSLARPASLALSFVIGGVTGASLMRATQPRPEVVVVDRSGQPQHTVAVATAPPSSVGSSTPAAILPVEPSVRPLVERAPRPNEPGAHLAAERALLDVSRTALARGEGDDALAAIAKHERMYPSGVLSEEREAIAVQALIVVQRYADARARGARFHERFPGSVMMPAVDAALASIP